MPPTNDERASSSSIANTVVITSHTPSLPRSLDRDQDHVSTLHTSSYGNSLRRKNPKTKTMYPHFILHTTVVLALFVSTLNIWLTITEYHHHHHHWNSSLKRITKVFSKTLIRTNSSAISSSSIFIIIITIINRRSGFSSHTSHGHKTGTKKKQKQRKNINY